MALPKKLSVAAFKRRKDIGRAIKQLREERGLTVMEAAVAAGTSTSTWTRWERGETAIPLELVADICKALNTDAVRSIKPFLIAA